MIVLNKFTEFLKKLFKIILLIIAVKIGLFVLYMASGEKRVSETRKGLETLTSTPIPENELQALAERFWISTEDQVAAIFPVEPERIGSISATSEGHAYQAAYNAEEFSALYAITFAPANEVLRSDAERALLAINQFYAFSMNASEIAPYPKWSTFTDGSPMLWFRIRFDEKEMPFDSVGFWIINEDRVIRVSVAYTGGANQEELAQIADFLQGFTTLNN